MDAAAELGRNRVSKHQIQPEFGDEQADAGRTAEPVSRDQILRRERGQGNINLSCSADHKPDWQPFTRLIYTLAICVTIHTYKVGFLPDTYYVDPRLYQHWGIRLIRLNPVKSFCLCSQKKCSDLQYLVNV